MSKSKELKIVDFSWITHSLVKNFPYPSLTFVFLGDHGKTLFMTMLSREDNINEFHLEDILENVREYSKTAYKTLERIMSNLLKIHSVEEFAEYLIREAPNIVIGETKYQINGKKIKISINLKYFLQYLPGIKVIEEVVYKKLYKKEPPIEFTGDVVSDIHNINDRRFEEEILKALKEKLYEDIKTFLDSITQKSRCIEIYCFYPKVSSDMRFPVPIKVLVIPSESLLRDEYKKSIISVCKEYRGIFVFLPPEIVYPSSRKEFSKIVDIIINPDVPYKFTRKVSEKTKEKVKLTRNLLDILRTVNKNHIVFVIPRYDKKMLDEEIVPTIVYREKTERFLRKFLRKTLERTIKSALGEKYWDDSLSKRIPAGEVLERSLAYIEYYIITKIAENLGIKNFTIAKTSSLRKITYINLQRIMINIIAKDNKLWADFSRSLRKFLKKIEPFSEM